MCRKLHRPRLSLDLLLTITVAADEPYSASLNHCNRT